MGKRPRGRKLWQAVYSTLESLEDALSIFLLNRLRLTPRSWKPVYGWAGLESLESRRLFTATPYISGIRDAQADVLYTLDLHANGANHWSVDWGDGSGVQTGIPASTTSIQHIYPTAGSSYTITATAFDSSDRTIATRHLGGVDFSFATSGPAVVNLSALSVQAVAIEPDNGAVLVLTDSGIEKFNADGSQVTSFGTGGVASLPSGGFSYIAVDDTGGFAIGGTDSNDLLIATYDGDGELTNTYSQYEPTNTSVTTYYNTYTASFSATDLQIDNSGFPTLSGYSSHFYEDTSSATYNFGSFAVTLTPDGYGENLGGQANTFTHQVVLNNGETLTPDSSFNALTLTDASNNPDDTFGPSGYQSIDLSGDGIGDVAQLDSGDFEAASLSSSGNLDITRVVPFNEVTVGNSPLLIPPATEGSPITITPTSMPFAGSSDAITYTWSAWNPSGSSYSLSSAAGTSLTFTPNTTGTWTVGLVVTDTTTSTSVTLGAQVFSVARARPVLAVSGNPTAQAGATYTLHLSAEYPANDTDDGTNPMWTIDWGDGSTTTTSAGATSATHIFTSGGPIDSISATATDQYSTYVVSGISLDPGYGTNGQILTAALPSVTGNASIIGQQPGGGYNTLGYDSASGDFVVSQFLPSGALDTNFHTTGTLVVSTGYSNFSAIGSVDGNGNIVVVGMNHGTTPGLVLYRVTSAGVVASGWPVSTPISSPSAVSLAVAPDGSIFVVESSRLVKFTSAGALDSSFGSNGIVSLSTSGLTNILVLPNGNIILYGPTTEVVNEFDMHGTAVPFFGAGNSINSVFNKSVITAGPDGTLIAAGTVSTGVGSSIQQSLVLGRFNADGTPDSTFNAGNTLQLSPSFSISRPDVLAVESDGSILVGSAAGGAISVARFSPYGKIDPTFATLGVGSAAFSSQVGSVQSLSIQSNGDIVAAGLGGSGASTYLAAASFLPANTLQTPSSQIIGPTTSTEGSAVTYSVAGGGVSGYTYVWSVTANGQTVAGDLGSTFTFTTGLSGSYQVKLTTLIPSGTPTLSQQSLVVAAIAPQNVSITGPNSISPRHSAVFTANATAPVAGDNPLTYSWNVFTSSGSSVSLTGLATNLATFSLPSTLASGDVYRVTVTVGDSESQTAMASQTVVVGTNNNGTVLTSETSRGLFYEQVLGQIVQSDGGIIEAEVVGATNGTDLTDPEIVLVRYLADLKVDTTGTVWPADGAVTLGPASTYTVMQLGAFVSDTQAHPVPQSDLQAQDIFQPGSAPQSQLAQQSDGKIVFGTVADHDGAEGFLIFRLNSYGTPDTSFGTLTDASDLKIGQTYVNFPNEPLLRRGEADNVSDIEEPRAELRALAIEPHDGTFGIVAAGSVDDGTDLLSNVSRDWVVVRLNSSGGMDTSFGASGIATVNFNPPGEDNAHGHNEINAIAIQPDGKILVGGQTDSDGTTFTLARFDVNGTLDATFGKHDNGLIRGNQAGWGEAVDGILIQTEGDGFNIVVTATEYVSTNTASPRYGTGSGGYYYYYYNTSGIDYNTDSEAPEFRGGMTEDTIVSRFNSSGTLDQSFGSLDSGTVILSGAAVGAVADYNGDLWVGGTVNRYDYSYSFEVQMWTEQAQFPADDFSLTELSGDGMINTSFGTGGTVLMNIMSPDTNNNVPLSDAVAVDNNLTYPTDPEYRTPPPFEYPDWAYTISLDHNSVIMGGGTWFNEDPGGSDGNGVLESSYYQHLSLARLSTSQTAWTPSLTASPITGGVQLNWVDSNLDDDGVEIQRSSNGGSTWSTLAFVPTGIGSYFDQSVAQGATESYRILAFAGTNVTSFSSAATAQAPVNTALTSPSLLTATANNPNGSIDLAWQLNSNSAASVVILRAGATGGFSTLTTLAAGATSYQDTSATTGTAYRYEVLTSLNSQLSNPSNEAGAALAGFAPVIEPVAIQQGYAGHLFQTQIYAYSPDGTPVTYAFVTSLSGMTINSSTGAISGWTPSTPGATATFIVQAANSSGSSRRMVTVVTSSESAVTLPTPTATVITPQDTSVALAIAPVTGMFGYTWSLLSGPAGAASPIFVVNGGSNGGAVACNAVAQINQAGTYIFNVAAADIYGVVSNAQVSIAVSAQVRNVVVTPVYSTARGGGTEVFHAFSVDQFGNPAIISSPSWSISGDSSSSINSGGTATFGTTFAVDTVTMSSGGLNAHASVTVLPGDLGTQTATFIAVQPTVANIFVSSPYVFSATLLDQNGLPMSSQPTSYTWTVKNSGGSTVTTGSGLTFTFTPSLAGSYSVTASASGCSGAAGVTATVSTDYVARIDSPVALPAGDALAVSSDLTVTGAIYDTANDLQSYNVVLIPDGNGGNITLASGTASIGSSSHNGTIAIVHPSLIPNGLYTMQLTATFAGGHVFVLDRTLEINTQFKDDNLSLPVTDMSVTTPAGQQIVVSRTYDSSQSNSTSSFIGSMGYGWSLNLLDAHLHTTAEPDSLDSSKTTFRPGDMVYLSVPGSGQLAFEFVPQVETDNFAADWGTAYVPEFVAVDGSGATLGLALPANNYPLVYSSSTNEYYAAVQYITSTSIGGFDFNPANTTDTGDGPIFGNEYKLTTKDGTTYTINATTGEIEQTADPNGNVVKYVVSNDQLTGAFVFNSAGDTSGTHSKTLLSVTLNTDGRITGITAPGQTVSYTYDGSGNLATSVNLAGVTTTYSFYGSGHLLNNVVSSGVTELQATYNTATSGLASLTGPTGATIPMSDSGFNGVTGSETVTDPLGNVTTYIYNSRGNVIRQIKQVTDSQGDVTGYVVTVSQYDYQAVAGGLDSQTQPPIVIPASIEQFAPFEITGADPDGLRFTQQPANTAWTSQIVFVVPSSTADITMGQIASTSQRIDSSGRLQTTVFSDFTVVNSALTANPFYMQQVVKPLTSTVEIQTPSGGGYTNHTESLTFFNYNTDGLLIGQVNALGEGVSTTYTPIFSSFSGSNQPGGSATETQNIIIPIVSGAPDWTLTHVTLGSGISSTNYFTFDQQYTSGHTEVGAIYGRPESTENAANQKTIYGFTSAGLLGLQYVEKTWTNSNGSAGSGLVGTRYVYNAAGQLTDTFQATYTGTVSGDPPMVNAEDGINITLDPAYYELVTGSEVHTQHITYTSLGQQAETVDAYGGTTSYTYNTSGQLIRTQNPDGTETRTVYDALGRAIWTSDKSSPSGAGGMATHTIYNSLGQAIETDRYAGAVIWISTDITGAEPISTSFVSRPGTLVSSDLSWYDESGRVIETKNPAGLRTGTIYYPNGQVEYTGPLASSATDGGELQTVNGVQVHGFSTGDFSYYTTNLNDQYDSTLHLFYNRVTDALGHHTDTYVDAAGRTVRTVYDDGSFTETLYSVGSTAVSEDQEGDTIPNPTTWSSMNSDQTETVTIGQRKSTDPTDQIVRTYDVFDASGNLTDVYQPPVMDAGASDSTTFGETTNPHWHYGYDSSGNETSQTGAVVSVNTDTEITTYESTTFAFDANNNMIARTLPDGETESYTFDALGQELTHVDFNGNTATYTYYNSYGSGTYVGSVEEIVYTGASGSGKTTDTVAYTYDALGRQSTVNDSANGLTRYTYDPIFGNQAVVESPQGTISYQYNNTGQLSAAYTANTIETYAYDIYGQLNEVQMCNSSRIYGGQISLTNPVTTIYFYDNVGNITTERDSGGSSTINSINYTYDDLNRLTHVQMVTERSIEFDQTYTLNDDGTRKQVVEVYDGGASYTTKWSYDALQRLTGETLSTTVSNSSYTDSYTYDLNSNRTEKVHVGPGGVGANDTTTFTYNGNDQLTSQTDTYSGSTPTTTTSMAYDSNGSLTSSTLGAAVTNYTYDVRNRMNSYVSPSGVTTTYVYDDAGNRVKETTAGTSTFYLTDTNNPTGYSQPIEVASTAGGSPTMTYELAQSVTAQCSGSGNIQFLLQDGHGSVRLIVNTSYYLSPIQTIDAFYNYDAFGNALGFNPATAVTPFLFGGDAVFDPRSGLYLHGNGIRPSDGFFFIQMDGVQYSQKANPVTLNKYLYAGADPVNGIDPSGHDALSDEAFAEAGLYQLNESTNLQAIEDATTEGLGLSSAYDAEGNLGNAFSYGSDLDVAAAWVKGFFEGAAQGALNVLNGITDTVIGLANVGIKGALLSLGPEALEFSPTIPAPDWSNGLIYNEDPTEHTISKLLGGLGASLASGGIIGAVGEGGAAAELSAEDLSLTETVANNAASRPYVNSRLLVQEIMDSGPGAADPGGLPGGLRWDAPGSFNGSNGTYELVVNPATKQIVHFLFTSS